MRKGQEWIGGIFALLMAGVIALALQVILPGQATKIAPEVEQNEFENKAIILANSLLGNEKLIYYNIDTKSYQLAVIDKDKLDSLREGTTSINLFYPDTAVHAVVGDKKTSEIWSFFVQDDKSENVKRLMDCIKLTPPEYEDPIISCSKRHSNVINNGFPVLIRYPGGSLNFGVILLKVFE